MKPLATKNKVQTDHLGGTVPSHSPLIPKCLPTQKPQTYREKKNTTVYFCQCLEAAFSVYPPETRANVWRTDCYQYHMDSSIRLQEQTILYSKIKVITNTAQRPMKWTLGLYVYFARGLCSGAALKEHSPWRAQQRQDGILPGS